MVVNAESKASAPTHLAPQPSPVSARTSEWIRVLDEALSGSTHPCAPNPARLDVSNLDSQARSPSLSSPTLPSSGTIDSEHSSCIPGAASLLADSYDPWPGIEAALAYLAQHRTPGTPRAGGAR
ncbi:hypothetical protein KC19_VG332000 [Ceratodon purpureus]|uniref:Uncharacterized protein n=1 Tax=Ceratodon purpureus TaxID=3225 RepID=A0A8T0HX13_CERPU|nr:hypothetical protein KC19_VG332000 [Ceratodon purpureus]